MGVPIPYNACLSPWYQEMTPSPQPLTLRSWVQTPQLLSPSLASRWDCYLKNWVRLLVGIRPKDTTKPKGRRKGDVLLAGSKENMEDLSQRSVFPAARLGKC